MQAACAVRIAAALLFTAAQMEYIMKTRKAPCFMCAVTFLNAMHIFMLGYVPTESMEPTLKTGSLILGLRLFDDLENGDIIIFRHDGSYLVKRVAACAGDTFVHQNTIVTVPESSYYAAPLFL